MRCPSWTPSIVPDDNDQTVFLVADDFGKPGRAWAQAGYERTDLEAIIQDLLTGQYSNPIRIVAFNTAERWSEDVSIEIAQELPDLRGPLVKWWLLRYYQMPMRLRVDSHSFSEMKK